MSVTIIPEKMEGGMILAVRVRQEGKEEVFTIPPAPFEGFGEMQRIIQTYYELDVLWQEANRELEFARQRFALVDSKYRVAKRDFKLLVSPQAVVETQVSEQIKAEGVQKPGEIKQVEMTITPSALPEQQPGVADTIKTSFIAQKQAETPEKPPEPRMVRLLKESPTLQVAQIGDKLPPKAKEVLDTIAKEIEVAKEVPPPEPQPRPKTPAEWCTAVAPKAWDVLAEKQFGIEELEGVIAGNGVPEKHVERVAELIISLWQREGRFVEGGGSFTTFLKSIPEKVGLGKKKKATDGGKQSG